MALAPLPASAHGEPLNVPVPLVLKLTVPVGLPCEPASVTVAVQVTPKVTTVAVGAQATVVVVVSTVAATTMGVGCRSVTAVRPSTSSRAATSQADQRADRVARQAENNGLFFNTKKERLAGLHVHLVEDWLDPEVAEHVGDQIFFARRYTAGD